MIPEGDRAVRDWMNQMADALKSGITPVEAVEISAGLRRPSSERIRVALEEGKGWEEVVVDDCPFLDDSEVAVLVAASRSGSLPESLEMLAASRESRVRSKRLMVLGSLYPLALLHLAILIVPVQRLMDAEYARYAVGVAVIVIPFYAIAGLALLAFRLFPQVLNQLLRWLPLVSGYAKMRSAAICAGVLGASVRSGLRIDEAWDLATQATQSRQYERLGDRARVTVGNGQPVGPVLVGEKWLPRDFASAYGTAEKSGTLDQALIRLSERYDDAARARLKVAIGAYTGMILLVAMGFAAWQVISFYADYFQRIENLGS